MDSILARLSLRPHRKILQFHTSLRRSLVALLLIAVRTGNNNVLPYGLSALGFRNNVLVFEFLARDLKATVLALATVASIDILARKLYRGPIPANILQYPHDRRHCPLFMSGTNLLIFVFLY
jgi:hypothetical protein